MRIIVFVYLFLSTFISAQTGLYTSTFKSTALDVITEPSSVAMGESFVANPFGKSSFFENPATLSGEHTSGLFYFSRSNDWMANAKGFRYSSIGISTASSFGQLAFSYNQFSTGRMLIDNQPEQFWEEKNTVYVLALAKPLSSNITLGGSLKIFNHARTSNVLNNYELSSNSPLLFDIGLLYSFPKIELTERTDLRSFIGTSLQNFGQNYRETDRLLNIDDQIVRLPRYLRIGFASNLQIINQSGSIDINTTITCEYKGLINPMNEEACDVDYWGGGIELTIKEYFSVRAGFFQTPEYTALYERAKFLFRYGAGFNFPLKKIGLNIPATVSLDYTFIPINQFEYGIEGTSGESNTKLLHAVGISLFTDFHF